MSAIHFPPKQHTRNAVLSCLSSTRRRRLLALLEDRGSRVPVTEVAAALAAAERGTAPDAVDEEAARSVRVSLLHAHLPKLADLDLVAWDREAGTVAPTDHPTLEDDLVARVLDHRGDEWDDVVDCIADERRRELLKVLRRAESSLSRAALAEELRSRVARGQPDPAATDDVERDLHHVHLPKLDAAGLVDYDRDDGTVAYGGHQVLPEPDAI